MVSLCNKRLHLLVGFRAPGASLHAGILAKKEVEREIGTPFLEGLDHGKGVAGCGSLQQRLTELHRVLCHHGHEPLHVGDGENGADRGPRVMPLRQVGGHKPTGPTHERL